MNYNLKLGMTLFLISSCGVKDNSEIKEFQGPNDAFRIGRGFDENSNRSQVRGDCIKNPERYLQVSWEDAQGVEAVLSETKIETHEELMKELSFSMNASASYNFYSGSASYSKYEKFTGTEDSFTWLFQIDAKVGTKTLRMDQLTIDDLTTNAKTLALQGKIDPSAKEAFYRLCGKKFIRSVVLGGSIKDVVEINAKAVEEIRRIKADISGGGGGGVWSASGSVAFSEVMESASRSRFLKREFEQRGGRDIYSGINHENKERVLKKFKNSLTKQNAAVIKVEMADWDTFLSWEPNSIDLMRQIALEDLLRKLWTNRAKMEKVDMIIYFYESNQIELSSSEIETLKNVYQKLQDQNNLINQHGRKCYVNNDCNYNLEFISVNFPAISFNPKPYYAYVLGGWKFNFPLEGQYFRDIPGELDYWGTNGGLHSYSKNFELVEFVVELFKSNCNDYSNYTVLDESSLSGDNLRFTKWGRTNSNGSKSVFSFSYKGNGHCLYVNLLQESYTNEAIELNDNSEASKMIRRIVKSIQHI